MARTTPRRLSATLGNIGCCAESMQNIVEVPGLARASNPDLPIALPPPRALTDSRCVAEGWLRKRAADRPAAMHSWLLPQPVAFRISLFEPRANFNPSVALAESVVLRWRGGYGVRRLPLRSLSFER